MKIDLILTGGTIGSEAGKDSVIDTDSDAALSRLIDDLYRKHPEYKEKIDFQISAPIDLLSENLSLDHWNDLIEHLKNIDFKDSDGVIITHGTDTLAFTANLLALLFFGTDIPVFLVSSSKPLTDANANGYDHFNKSVDLLMEGIKPSVYVPYKNKNDDVYIHEGGRLMQSADLSPDFHSAHHKLNDVQKICRELSENGPILNKIEKLNGNILCISPYPGLDYGNYDLEQVDAVLHRTYHSSTVSAENEEDFSVLSLKKRCDEKCIPIYFTPILSSSKQVYSSTDKIIKRGIIPLFDMTFEMSYVYLLIKNSL